MVKCAWFSCILVKVHESSMKLCLMSQHDSMVIHQNYWSHKEINERSYCIRNYTLKNLINTPNFCTWKYSAGNKRENKRWNAHVQNLSNFNLRFNDIILKYSSGINKKFLIFNEVRSPEACLFNHPWNCLILYSDV